MWIIAVIILLLALYMWCLKGRTGHQELPKFLGWNYAHRGLHNANRPENSLAAFQAALEAGCGIELDVHLMKDGNLAVIHDSNLKRTAGADVRVEDLTAADLVKYRLDGTQEQIPLFSQVLALYDGKAPLIVELKVEKGNYAALCAAACDMLDNYDGLYCLESFDPRAVHWLRKYRPDLVRGQLSENWFHSKAKLPWILKWIMTSHISNIYTRPDFIAYKFGDRKTLGTAICRKIWRLQGVSWTLRTRQEYDQAVSEGWIPIFENFTL